jgi:WD40 repeat protein
MASALSAASASSELTRDALVILKNDCSGCHNAEKHKGGLDLSSREALLKGGDEGGVVNLADAEKSRLLTVLRSDADPHMPPKKQLDNAQIATLSQWVREGLTWDAAAWNQEDSAPVVRLDALPSSYHPVGAIALSPDGKRLAVGHGGWLSLFEVGQTNFPLTASAEAHQDVIQSLAWSRDGSRLASGGFGRVILWNPATLKREREWTNGIFGRVTAMEFAPVEPMLCIAHGIQGGNGLLRLISWGSDDPTVSWKAHADTIYDLEYSRDGQRLVTASGDRLIRVWEVASRREVATLEGHVAQVLAVAFNTNATQVASGGADKELKVWDVATREKLVNLGQHTSPLSALAWTGESQRLFSIREDGSVFRYTDLKAHNGEQSSATGQERKLGVLPDAGVCLAVSADQQRVFVGSQAGKVHIWDGEGKALGVLEPPSGKPAFLGHSAGTQPYVASTPSKTARKASSPDTQRATGSSEAQRQLPVVSLKAAPVEVRLTPGGWPHGVLITAVESDGFERDVTTQARFVRPAQAPFELGVYGELRAVRPGRGTLVAHFGGRRAEIAVEVEAPQKTASAASGGEVVSFVRDVLPALSRAGCNAGGCHAKPEGQNGFRLSVFSFDPQADYHEIVKEAHGRRIFPSAPEQSLLLLKPGGGLPHEGGVRFEPNSATYELLVRWIRTGMTYQADQEPALAGIQVFPREQRYRKGSSQRLLVQARYSDGTVRDVTRLSAFVPNDKEIVKVSESGLMEIGTLTGQGVVVARYMGYVADSQILVPADHGLPEGVFASLPRQNFIDDHAYAVFQRLGILPSERCTDLEFLRRAKLDAIGVLPTPEEVQQFTKDPSPDKRARLIDQVLADPAYADYWANKWADLLRPNPDRVGVKSIFTLDQWLRESFRQNKPYDQFVREILVAEGSNHSDGPAVVYRDRREPADLTTMFSQLFLGTRLECARCHHHPNEKWGQEDFYQFAAFFGPLKQKGAGLSPPISAGTETFYFAPGGAVKHPVSGAVMAPRPPEGPDLQLPESQDPRRALADWLTAPGNPFFARAAVNRVWAAFFGRGLVEPVDDFRISNPCVNPALLSALADDFVKHGYDLKHLMRTLMNSRLYQLSSVPHERNLADTRNFSRSYRRRLPAEVLLDAVNDATGIPDTFAAMPPGTRAMQAWSYKIDSHFLDAFGRPNASSDCPCERDLQLSVVQSLHLMNAKGLQSKLSHPEGRARQLAESARSPAEIVTELYLLTLNRPPNARERQVALGVFAAPGASRQTATEDIFWALLNSAEFVFNH